MTMWSEGARLRTLPAALSPVIVGAAVAYSVNSFSVPRTALAVWVALCLQIGVNFSNDYSDGIRGTDDHRAGPQRLTASGAVHPRTVLLVALTFFALAACAGLVLVALSGTWWLIGVGALAIIAAWFYTGGKHPYGYLGVGVSELLVFVFFGLVAVAGTTYTQALFVPASAWVLGVGAGAISVALLMVNNIRDRATDSVVGKTTLVVRLGDGLSRAMYVVSLVLAPACVIVVWPTSVVGWVLLIGPVLLGYAMMNTDTRQGYLALLRRTGLFLLAYASGVVAASVWGV